MRIGGAIFDADGTILDSMKIWEELGVRYLRTMGIKAEEHLAKILSEMSMKEGSRYLKKRYGLKMSLEEIHVGLLEILSDYYAYEVQAKPGISSFLKELKEKKIPVTIATSGDKILLEQALKRLDIRSCFDRIFTCGELDTTKREPLIYQAAAAYMGTEISETVVFEDALFALKTAKQAGFQTAAVQERTGEESEKSKEEELKKTADYYLIDFLDFTQFWKTASDK